MAHSPGQMIRGAAIYGLGALAGCSTHLPGYDQVIAQGEEQWRAPHVEEWTQRTFLPFWNRNLDIILRSCAPLVPESSSLTARFVVAAPVVGKQVAINDEASTPFSTCMKDRFLTLDWPSPPSGIRYLPFEITVHMPTQVDQQSDNVITDVRSSNKSLERTQEK